MRKLIDQQAAIDAATKFRVTPGGEFFEAIRRAVQSELEALPPVDAVPVVRCNDCNEYQDNFHWCKLHDVEMQPMDFCSYGERKDG